MSYPSLSPMWHRWQLVTSDHRGSVSVTVVPKPTCLCSHHHRLSITGICRRNKGQIKDKGERNLNRICFPVSNYFSITCARVRCLLSPTFRSQSQSPALTLQSSTIVAGGLMSNSCFGRANTNQRPFFTVWTLPSFTKRCRLPHFLQALILSPRYLSIQ